MSEIRGDVAVRALGPADLDAYRRLRQRGLAEHPEAFTSSHDEEAALPADRLARRLAPDPSRPHDVVLGAFVGGELAGLCGMDVDMRAKVRHKGHVFGLYVPSERASRGLGGALIDRVVAHARDRGLAQLTLTCTAANLPARRVYERAGFAMVGREPHAIRVDGKSHDKVLMVLFLNPEKR